MKQYSRTKILFLLLLFIIIFNIFLWQRVGATGAGHLQVTFLDVGQGDAILIEAPNGVQMLIDGGRDDSIISDLRGELPINDQTLDIVLSTHPDADHIGGLPAVLENYEVSKIIGNGDESSTQIFKKLKQEEKEEGSEIIKAARGTRIILDTEENIYFDVLWPASNAVLDGDTNTYSIIGRLVYGEREFLLNGDADTFAEGKLVDWCSECLKSDVLKAGHHGSRTSSSKSFVSAVAPSYTVVSAGLNNSYGHPHKEVVSLFNSLNIPVLETAKEGTITFETDGIGLWLR